MAAVGTEAEAKAAEAWVEAEREAVARAVKEAEEREAAAMEVAEAQEAATTEVAEALEAAAMEARMEAARSVAGGGECAADVGHFGGGWQERTAERRIKFIWSERPTEGLYKPDPSTVSVGSVKGKQRAKHKHFR